MIDRNGRPIKKEYDEKVATDTLLKMFETMITINEVDKVFLAA